MISMQYPNNPSLNKSFDGKKHAIEPRTLLYKKGVYFLIYFDKDLNKDNMITYLIKKGDKFYKLPLKDYKKALPISSTFLINAQTINIDELSSDIGCLNIIDIDELKGYFKKDAPEKDASVDKPKSAPAAGATHPPKGPEEPKSSSKKKLVIPVIDGPEFYIPVEIAVTNGFDLTGRKKIKYDYNYFSRWVSVAEFDIEVLKAKYDIKIIGRIAAVTKNPPTPPKGPEVGSPVEPPKPPKKPEEKPAKKEIIEGRLIMDLNVLEHGKYKYVPIESLKLAKSEADKRPQVIYDYPPFKKWIQVLPAELDELARSYNLKIIHPSVTIVEYDGKYYARNGVLINAGLLDLDAPYVDFNTLKFDFSEEITQARYFEVSKNLFPNIKIVHATKKGVKKDKFSDTSVKDEKKPGNSLPQDKSKPELIVIREGAKKYIDLNAIFRLNLPLYNRPVKEFSASQIPASGKYYEVTPQELEKAKSKFDLKEVQVLTYSYKYTKPMEEEPKKSR